MTKLPWKISAHEIYYSGAVVSNVSDNRRILHLNRQQNQRRLVCEQWVQWVCRRLSLVCLLAARLSDFVTTNDFWHLEFDGTQQTRAMRLLLMFVYSEKTYEICSTCAYRTSTTHKIISMHSALWVSVCCSCCFHPSCLCSQTVEHTSERTSKRTWAKAIMCVWSSAFLLSNCCISLCIHHYSSLFFFYFFAKRNVFPWIENKR